MNTLIFNNGAQVRDILEWAIIIILILFLVTLLVLMVSKIKTENYAKNIQNSTIKYRNIFLNKAFSAAVTEVTSLSKIDRDGMIMAYRELLLKNPHGIKDKLIALISSSDAVPYYVEKAKNRNPEERLHAYLQLNRIGLAGLRDFFFESAEKETEKNEDGKLIAACLLSAAKLSTDKNDIIKLVNFINKNGKLARGLQEGLIIQAAKSVLVIHGNDALVDVFSELLENQEGHDTIYSSIIAAIGKLSLDPMVFQLNSIYNKLYEKDDTSVIKISCLRALSGLMITDQTIQSLKSGFLDKDWRVRATACISAGILKLPTLNENLCELLGDSAYYVRLNAARALVQVGSKGELEKIIADSGKSENDLKDDPDPYRKSVCHYVLSEEEYHD